MLNGLDLFSGIGGITLALKDYVRPVAYCEIEPYAAGVLFSRMLDGSLPKAPIFPDIRTLTSKILPPIDIIYGGFPCQPYSTAARGRNKRDSLMCEFIRLIKEIAPAFVFAENVSEKAVGALAAAIPSYQSEILKFDAADVGAPHIRSRYWLLANANNKSESDVQIDAEVARVSTVTKNIWNETNAESLRMDDGIPFRMDRLKSLGNAVVPQCAKEAFEVLMLREKLGGGASD